MLTLEETLADQENLTRLCDDKHLEPNEIFHINRYYGHGYVYKQYAGLPEDYPLKIALTHGIDSYNIPCQKELAGHLLDIYVYRNETQELYLNALKTLGVKTTVTLAASPYLYVIDLLKNQPAPPRKGTLFFPSHSAGQYIVKADFDAIANKLENLEDRYKPVTVCIFYRDFQRGHHKAFQKRGLRIVSAGHGLDPNFLFRFFRLCSTHAYSAGMCFGTSLFYAVKAGCSHFHIDGLEYWWVHKTSKHLGKTNPPVTDHSLALGSLFKTPGDTATAEQTAAVDHYLGAAHFKQPHELRLQLLEAEVPHGKSNCPHFLCPRCRATEQSHFCTLQRPWKRLKRLLKLAR
ncbi:MAG: hypothetical protein Q8R76_10145 [Candidatus Omnitrophota bacterium]|nr:hypothetical protein [Candidatus Omnitrophota bacterium]